MADGDLDDLLTAIEGLRCDRKAAFTVLMLAACTCLHIVLDQTEPGLRERVEESDDAGFRVMIWGEHRIDLLVDDRFVRLAAVPPGALAAARQ